MKVFVIIPAWNEEASIGEVLSHLAGYDYQVVVVDDGSSDRTAEIALTFPQVVVLRHLINRGQGAALATGMEYAVRRGADIVVHFDADGQMMAEEIFSLIRPLTDDPTLDIVLGSKFLNGKVDIPFFKKHFLLKPALIFQKLTTGLNLTDVHNGFRALTRRAAAKIEIQQDAMAHASEIVLEIKKHRLKYTEVPVTVIYKEFGQGLTGGLKIIKDLIIRRIIK